MAPSPMFLGRCKRCKARARLAPTNVERLESHLGYGRVEYRYFYDLPGHGRTEGRYDYLFLPCLCGMHVKFSRLRGRLGPKKCGAKCMNATGPNCECSCRGENHGGAHG